MKMRKEKERSGESGGEIRALPLPSWDGRACQVDVTGWELPIASARTGALFSRHAIERRHRLGLP